MLEGSKTCELPGFLASKSPSLKPFAMSNELYTTKEGAHRQLEESRNRFQDLKGLAGLSGWMDRIGRLSVGQPHSICLWIAILTFGFQRLLW
jgi:hypothetical protein